MKHRFEDHPDFTDYIWYPGKDTHPMLKKRSDAFMALPEAERMADFIIPNVIGDYCLKAGDWTLGTHHHNDQPYLITSVQILGDEHWDHWEWYRGYKPISGVKVHCYRAIRLDDYLKHGCKRTTRDEQYSGFGGYVPQDDHLTEIVNGWRGQIKIWKVPEPEAVTRAKHGQLALL
ncbi:hypothetical protein [Fibrella aquatilis]|uniref:Uncharacterized protein n=1 Tax=Fibrella aquatilis TaxID=2817059 RepID=A0A939K2A8_9BACT|nr:hypothetical protein [Fibrella aquatilis]MBO0933896.1 hypothetical protein [Fibrella aquatilis]